MAIITRELAAVIAKKLEAEIKGRPGAAHDLARVYHQGKRIASFGIRRGARKDLGHDHIPGDLHIRPHQARLLGQCPMTREQWLAILREKGLI